MTELNERYNSCRAKTADTVAAAVKHKEDVCISSSLLTFLHIGVTPFVALFCGLLKLK